MMSLKHCWSILLLSAAFVCFADAGGVFQVGFTGKNPFSDPKKITVAWSEADKAAGFVIPGKYSVETFRTEASMLFDDANLHILLTGYSRPQFKAPKRERSVFEDNNFEVFLAPEGTENTYWQIAVAQSGKVYTAKSSGGKRAQTALPGLQCSVKRDWAFWRAMLSVPLSSLGIAAPPAGKTLPMRFNFCRRNIDFPAKDGEDASFAVLDSLNYHNPAEWNTAVLSREKTRDAKTWYSRSERVRINLIPDSVFAVAKDNRLAAWYVNPRDVARKETAEFSGQWVMRCGNNAYQVLTAAVPSLEEGKTYTLRIRARQFGGANAIGAMQLRRRPDGKNGYREGKSIVWRLPVTDEFREYTLHFVAEKDAVAISFYRFGDRKPESGVEYASIRLYEGKLSSFEIRKVSRMGGKSVMPGTDMLPPPNLYGRMEETLSALAVCEDLVLTRDPLELFSGLNVHCDSITTTGNDADLYYTDGDPAAIQKKLEDGSYDLYLVGRNIGKIGKGLAAYMEKNVKNGAGLLIANASAYGNLASLVKQGRVPEKCLEGIFRGDGGVFDFF